MLYVHTLYTSFTASYIIARLNNLAASSKNCMSPGSVKFLPVQIPSSSGDTTSSETALSSTAFGVKFWKETAKTKKLKFREIATMYVHKNHYF